jgi:3-methyladenine DNA glycosylase AlkD
MNRRGAAARYPSVVAKPPSTAPSSIPQQVATILASLEKAGTDHDVANLARFGITAPKAFGVSVAKIRALAKQIGKSHEVAEGLWKSGWYEARMLAAFVDDPALVTPAQMDRWCRDFDNWGICDTLCFHLFDRTPHAWKKIASWNDRKAEFVKRASYALLASVALHDKKADDEPFLEALPWIERAATDDRNFVKKGVSWALRSIGHRNERMKNECLALARKLATSTDASSRWIGKDAIKDLSRPARKRAADSR